METDKTGGYSQTEVVKPVVNSVVAETLPETVEDEQTHEEVVHNEQETERDEVNMNSKSHVDDISGADDAPRLIYSSTMSGDN